jgi:hypothetical protein
MTIDTLLHGKIRVKLLTRLLLNPASRVYLRGLEKDFAVSSNTVRVELNKLSDLKLIEVDETVTAQKQYKANTLHRLSVRAIHERGIRGRVALFRFLDLRLYHRY